MQNYFPRLWAHDNGIMINVNKTKCVIIHYSYRKQKEFSITLKGH